MHPHATNLGPSRCRSLGCLWHPAAAHLAQAAVRLPGQARNPPAGDHALGAAALGDGDGVDHLVLAEHGRHGYALLE